MSRYYGSGGSFRQKRPAEEVDPMSSMGNMGDIMLVFACGLMVALIVAWNLDLGQFTQVKMDESTEVDEVQQITEMLYGEGNAFVEKGTVYQDPTTGKYYLVEEGADASAATVNNTAGSSGGASETEEGPATGGTETSGEGA